MDVYSMIVSFFQSGGTFMYPIVVVLILGLAISTERYVYLTQAKIRNRMVWNELMPLLVNGKYQQAVTVAKKSKTAMSRILTYGLARAKNATHRDDVETAMEEGLMEAVPRFEKRTHYRRDVCQHRHLAGIAGHHHGPDSGVHCRIQCEPGGKGRHAVREYFRGDEYHRLRSDGRDTLAAGLYRIADQNHRVG